MGRTNLSRRAHTLQLSLLASLGLVPVACGGSAVTSGPGDQALGGTGGGGGAVAYGGDLPAYGGTSPYGGDGVTYGGSSPAHGGSGGRGIVACESPVLDPTTHLITCGNGFVHRPFAVACVLPPTSGGSAGAAGEPGEAGAPATLPAPADCRVDADCSSLRLGFCDSPGGQLPRCETGCLQDSDCAPQQLCLCNGSAHGGQCVFARCKADTECGGTSLCASASAPCSGTSFACLSPQDECTTNADCGNGTCETIDTPYRSCNNGVCGRPFLVAETARLAAVIASPEWLDDSALTPDLRKLGARARATLAAHWTRLAQMEHASIAAFARFSLQLLSVGAPAHLIEACTRAIADETAHTRLCFEMASHYGGLPLGPARLDISHCLDETSLTGIMKLVLSEGCLGETGAALEALEAAATATDPAVIQAFSRIARDEQRHAELAFQFLQWALARSPSSVRSQLAREAAVRLREFELAATPSERPLDTAEPDLSAHGLLSPTAIHAVRRHAARGVVAPLLASLLTAVQRRSDVSPATSLPPRACRHGLSNGAL